jgi:hypothetical protein
MEQPHTPSLTLSKQEIQASLQKHKKEIVFPFATPPALALLWFFLVVAICVGMLIWLIKIPTFANVSGVVLDQNSSLALSSENPGVMVFIPVTYLGQVHVPMTVSIIVNHKHFSDGTIKKVLPEIISPANAQSQTGLNSVTATMMITQPSFMAIVDVGSVTPVLHMNTGQVLTVQIQVGSLQLLQMLPMVFTQNDGS